MSKLYRLVIGVETEEDFPEKKILSRINTEVNRGEGIVLRTEDCSLKYIGNLNDETGDFIPLCDCKKG